MYTNFEADKYKNACRICLADGATIPLFHATKREYRDLNKKLFACFNEQIEDKNGFPRNICKMCFIKVEYVLSFQNKYRENCKLLESMLNMVVKQEIEEEYLYIDDIDYDVPEHDVKAENSKVGPKIVFSNGIQLVELIKPLVNKTTEETLKVKQEKINKNIKSSQPKNVKREKKPEIKIKKGNSKLKKNKETKKYKVKETINKNIFKKFGLGKNCVIASCILEGEFAFNGENWGLKPKKPKQKEVNNSEKATPIDKSKNTVNIPEEQSRKEPEARLCELCGVTFPSQTNLRAHIVKVHQEEDQKSNRKTQCNECGRVLCDSSALNRHMRSLHGVKDKVCPTCGKSFSLEDSLVRHINHLHLNIPRKRKARKTCHLCGKEYAASKQVMIHIRSAHTGERPEVCTICGARFHCVEYKREHMRLHTGETPYKCPVCSRGYAQNGNMKSHIKHNHQLSHLTETQRKIIHPRFLRLMKP